MAKTIRLAPCPFCGQSMELYEDQHVNDRGEVFKEWYIDGHAEPGCKMDEILDDLPAMDIDEAIRFAEWWNTRKGGNEGCTR